MQILLPFLLSACLAQFLVLDHLLGQKFAQDLLLLTLLVEPRLDSGLVFLGPKVRLEVALVVLALLGISQLSLSDLLDDKVLVPFLILLFSALSEVLELLLGMDAAIELLPLFLPEVFYARNVLVESLPCLLADIACNQVVLVAHVQGMVVDGKGTLGPHEFGDRGVIRVRYGLAIQGVLDYPPHLLWVLGRTAWLLVPSGGDHLCSSMACMGGSRPETRFSRLFVAALPLGADTKA